MHTDNAAVAKKTAFLRSVEALEGYKCVVGGAATPLLHCGRVARQLGVFLAAESVAVDCHGPRGVV